MDLLSKKYAQAKDISELKAENERLNNCLMESLTHEKEALDKSIEIKAENEHLKECVQELASDNLNTIQEMDNERRRVEQLREKNEKYEETLREIKVICDYENEYNSIGIDDYKKIIKDIVDLITKAESED